MRLALVAFYSRNFYALISFLLTVNGTSISSCKALRFCLIGCKLCATSDVSLGDFFLPFNELNF